MQDNDIFSRSKISVAVAVALASYGSAQAQETGTGQSVQQDDQERIEEVVTTGYRRSLEDTAALKMDSESIIEAVSAEEIGKLPDVSIAESLARLPGLTAQRLNGRGQVISVRGLSPDFTTALLNGREQVTAGDNRGVEFDQYPSEVLQRVVVYKTPDAALVGQGLAGTADLQTVSPLDHGEQTIAANVRYQWLENSDRGGDDDGTRYSLTYIDQFADDTIGVVAAVASMKNPSQADWFEAWGYASGPAGENVLGGAKAWVQNTDLQRNGFVGVLDYEPNDTFRTTVDVFFSEFNEDIGRRGLEAPLQWSSASLQPGYTVENGLITSGTYTGVKPVGRNDIDTRDSNLRSVGIKAEWNAGDDWVVAFDANHASINRTDQILETYIGTGSRANGQDLGAADTFDFTMTESGVRFDTGLDYSDPSLMLLTDPQGWGGSRWGDGGQVGFNKYFTIDDEINQLRLNAMGEVEWGFVNNVDFGINITQREKDMSNFEELLTTSGGTFNDVNFTVTGNASSVAIPSNIPITIARLDYVGIPGLVSYNPVSVYNSSAFFKVPFPFSDVTIKSWNIQEDVSTAYAKFGFDTSFGNVPVSGNFGVQAVHTDQKGRSKGASGSFENLVEVPILAGKDYWEVLPSFNVTFEVTDNSFVRFAGARTLARPRMDDLRPGLNFNFNTSAPCANATNAALLGCDPTDANDLAFSAGGGNSLLDPWIANAFDLSYERYFEDRAGYLALAVFYKDLDTYIYNQPALVDFTGFPTIGQSAPAASNNGSVSIPLNGEGGNIQGVEFALSLPGSMLAQALDGFGAFMTYSITDSEIEPQGPGTASALPGLSEDVGNLTVYYENPDIGFSARVSGRYRSDFLGEISGFANGRDFRTVQEETIVDAQVSYTMQGGPAEGLTFLLQGNNLTNEPFVTFDNNDPRQVRNYQEYGRSYLFGMSYVF